MKKLLLATVALVVLGAPALAADLRARPYTKAPPPIAAPIYNWTGFYIGAHLGVAFGNDDNFNGLVVGSNNDARFMGGVQGGFDYQFAPNWVLGAEAQYSWLSGNAMNVAFPNGYVYTNDRRGIGSVTGRFGYTWGPGLLYVKGNLLLREPSELQGAVVVTGTVRIEGASDYATVTFDDGIVNRLRQTLGSYRQASAVTRPLHGEH